MDGGGCCRHGDLLLGSSSSSSRESWAEKVGSGERWGDLRERLRAERRIFGKEAGHFTHKQHKASPRFNIVYSHTSTESSSYTNMPHHRSCTMEASYIDTHCFATQIAPGTQYCVFYATLFHTVARTPSFMRTREHI